MLPKLPVNASLSVPEFSLPRAPFRFIGWLACAVVAGCSGYAALVLHSSTWAEARQLDAIFPFYSWRIRWFASTELAQAWLLLLLLAAGFGTGALLMGVPVAGRTQICAGWAELRAALAGLWQAVATLPARQRRLAALAGAALTALRVWLSQAAVTPGYDDVPSYELFASKSLLAVTAYYPVPNNHVLSNTISWLCYHINPGFWFTMRLPVLLAATLATALLFAGLLKMGAGFWVAHLSVGLFGLAQLSLYHAAVGRGYWLLTLLAGIVFFSAMALDGPPLFTRAAWMGLLIGGVLGMFTVPTFALVLTSAYSWLGVAWAKQRNWAGLGQLAGVAVATLLASLLLYTPLLFVSGPASFFQNGFVAPLQGVQFWTGFPAYWWETEGFLAGQMKVGALATVAVLGAATWGLRRVGPALPTAWQRLARAAFWFMLVPYAVLAVQRVFAPGRALLYKAFFFFVLLSLVLEWLLHLHPLRKLRGARVLLGVSLILWTCYQLRSLAHDNQVPRRRNTAFHAAFEWLSRQPRGQILIPEPTQSIFVRMYLHSELPSQNWALDARPKSGVKYTYVLAFPDRRGQFQPWFSIPPAFHNEEVDIYYAPTIATNQYWQLAN